jgi:lipid A disaccharide synthetase
MSYNFPSKETSRTTAMCCSGTEYQEMLLVALPTVKKYAVPINTYASSTFLKSVQMHKVFIKVKQII